MIWRIPFAVAAAFAILPGVFGGGDAFADTSQAAPASADTAVTLAKPRQRSMILELSPFLSPVDPSQEVPGPVGLGLGAEALLKNGISAGAMVSYSQLRRSDGQVSRAQGYDPTFTDAVGVKLDAEAVQALVRYYVSPAATSWYGGAGVVVTRGTATNLLGASRVTKTFSGGFLTVEGGYRWLWANGFTFRLTGLGHSSPVTKDDLKFNGFNSGTKANVDTVTRNEITGVIPELRFSIGVSL